jgi:hypothetical protein
LIAQRGRLGWALITLSVLTISVAVMRLGAWLLVPRTLYNIVELPA